jgi:hypothetical protein
MSALAADRYTDEREEEFASVKVGNGAKIYGGAMVAINKDGFAVQSANTAGLKAIGRAEEAIDNTGGLDGAKAILIKRGIFKWLNDAALPITQEMLFTIAFIRDDQTVRAYDPAGGAPNPIAGLILDIDSDGGVWIETLNSGADNLPGAVDFTIGAEQANVIQISAQLKNIFGANIAFKSAVRVWLSDAAAGAICAVAPSGTVVAGTSGVIVDSLTAKTHLLVATSATGSFNLDITEADAKTLYLNIEWQGKIFTSAVVTFAA